MKEQIVDVLAFLVGLFYLLIGWATVKGGNSITGWLLAIGALFTLYGVLTSMRKAKPQSTNILVGGLGLIALIQLTMGSFLFAIIVGILAYLAYSSRQSKSKKK